MIIDIHGHYTTAPKQLEAWRNQQIAGIKDPAAKPQASDLKISDDELREVDRGEPAPVHAGARRGPDHLLAARELHGPSHRRLRRQLDLGRDLQRALLPRVARLFPDNFIGAAMLPQSPGVDPATCIPELEKCVKEYGFVGDQSQPRPLGRPLDQPAAHRPALVSDL